MRLFLVDKPGCHHVTELMPGIKAVYQLEQEFSPYLVVGFLPEETRPVNSPRNTSIIFQAAENDVVTLPYNLESAEELEKLRLLIWEKLLKYHKINDIAPNGCLTDLRLKPTNSVVQGWQARKRLIQPSTLELVKDMISSECVAQMIKHNAYTLSVNDEQTKTSCLSNRGLECSHNFPEGSPLYKRCMDTVNTYCQENYPSNRFVQAMLNVRAKLAANINEYLNRTGGRVDKQALDDILSAGFFDDVFMSAGNKVSYENIRKCMDKLQLPVYEPFSISNDYILLILGLVLGILIVLCAKKMKF